MANKRGRPQKPIDWDQVDKLCRMFCTGDEIAGFLGISYDTLYHRVKAEKGMTFSEYFKRHSGVGKIALRRKQFEIATSGNVSMLIWLGKQYLNQAEKQELSGRDGEAIKIENNEKLDLSRLSIDELEHLEELLAKGVKPTNTD